MRKTSGGHLKDLPTSFSIQQGHNKKVFFIHFSKCLHPIHPSMRTGQAVQFPPQLEHGNCVYEHKHSSGDHKRATFQAIKVLFSPFPWFL